MPYPDQETADAELSEMTLELEAYGQDVELDDDARALLRALLADTLTKS